jgi:carboxypeptidase Taq
MTKTPAYAFLHRQQQRLYRLDHLQNIASWDQATQMPPGGNEARAAALAELAALMHRDRADPALAHYLAQAKQEALDAMQHANLREIERAWQRTQAVPEWLVEQRTVLTSRCEHAWRAQRPRNDWAGFAANLKEVLALARQEANYLGDALGLSAYDALLDHYEPGMRAAEVTRIFAAVRQWLPSLIRQVQERQAGEAVVQPIGPFALPAQRSLCEQVVRWLGFDFAGGRLDVSTHPFTGGVPEDVRLTTRFRDDEFLQALLGTIHETGHGRYEQNLPRDWLGQPVAQSRSMAIHESQSLFFEMQLAAHPGFARHLSPLLVQAFGEQPAFEPANLHRLMTRVEPGLIRVEADELTYPAHIILRFEIERALIEGQAEVDDIPALWDAAMQDLLGLNTRGNYRDGAMQDVHWPAGLFGYFPCYSLGAMYAAQWMATIRQQQPGVDAQINAGDLSGVLGWLSDNIWQQGSRWPTDALAQRASGETLNPAHFRAHLEQRYLG